MLARLDHKVLRLKRTAIGPVTLGRLRSGKSRPLPAEDLARLRKSVERPGTAQEAPAAPEKPAPKKRLTPTNDQPAEPRKRPLSLKGRRPR